MALKARIHVTPRKDVLDPQGSAVTAALHSLGFGEARDVRLGRYVELRLATDDVAAAQARVEAMCEKLIANPVVEDYVFEILPDAEG